MGQADSTPAVYEQHRLPALLIMAYVCSEKKKKSIVSCTAMFTAYFGVHGDLLQLDPSQYRICYAHVQSNINPIDRELHIDIHLYTQ